MALNVSFASEIRVVETFLGPFVDPQDATMTTSLLSEREVYTATSDVPVEKHAAFELALTAGTGTIDMTALPGHGEESTVDGTGLRVQVAKFRNKSTNANPITVEIAAEDGYELLGSAWEFTLQPGQSLTLKGDEAAELIASDNKAITVTGTGTEVLQVQFVLGAAEE